MIKNIIFVCLIVFILIFVVQNTQVVEFRFLVWTISLSRALMLFGALAVGIVAGWFLRGPKQKKEQQGQSKRKKRTNKMVKGGFRATLALLISVIALIISMMAYYKTADKSRYLQHNISDSNCS